MARAIDLLSRREYSRRELTQRLRPHAQSPEELAQVLDQLAERTWQSDQRFAEQFSRSRAGKYGSLRLRQHLREKGVSGELIDEALSSQDDLATARAVWQRKFGTLPDSPQDKARQARFLAARGFPPEIIRKILAGRLDDNE
ncbi:recombination regulator RecX [Paludibacterium purpuratum]|uniref:Regulatory protein RecX n=1 Tax=Paludibacterium purpuratum TaxID=1144873 RepID=A0A4R7BAR7_9NEIS|nr:recombination regulator RecX [Paludibacterium purpuratum]TDR82050.1 regulatory protein [Paludibacterium purpuratum]